MSLIASSGGKRTTGRRSLLRTQIAWRHFNEPLRKLRWRGGKSRRFDWFLHKNGRRNPAINTGTPYNLARPRLFSRWKLSRLIAKATSRQPEYCARDEHDWTNDGDFDSSSCQKCGMTLWRHAMTECE